MQSVHADEQNVLDFVVCRQAGRGCGACERAQDQGTLNKIHDLPPGGDFR
jgi:hypothetical protein